MSEFVQVKTLSTKEEWDRFFDGYDPQYLVVRVAPTLMRDLLGQEYETEKDGRRYAISMQSVYLDWSPQYGLEATPVFHQRLLDEHH